MTARADLTDAQVERLKQLFEDALSTSSSDRETFVRDACDGDSVLQKELTSLLDAHDKSSGFFEKLSEDLLVPALERLELDDLDDDAGNNRTVLHYELIERIGKGGMGVVYKARDTRLGRTVALKFLPRRHASNPAARARLLAEARAASALDHPNIGVIYEIAEANDGQQFIAMAWYDGETLKQKTRRGSITVSEAVSISQQLGSALAAAHRAGIVHRDVKPANVLITPSGSAKLLDFGIAKLISSEDDESHAGAGTIAYMSPEQTRNAALDARTDIWSLGVLMYEMFSGSRPFAGDSDAAVIEAIRSAKQKPLSALRSDVSSSLTAIVDKCLEKDPTSRFASADELCEALNESTSGRALVSPALFWNRKRMGGTAALGLVLIAAAFVGSREYASRSSATSATKAGSTGTQTVAVLPFRNSAGNAADEPLVSGFTDALIETIGTFDKVRVPARASAAAFERQGMEPLAVGRKLGAGSILRGDFRRAGERYVVSAALVSTADGRVLWSRRYDRPAADAFVVQNEISQLVGKSLHPESGMQEPKAVPVPTRDLAAYELYLKGRFAWNQRTRDKLEEALADFREALERDPDFAQAHSAMSVAYINMSNFGYMPSAEALARAELAADRAIAIDSTLVDAHAARGFVLASRNAFRESEAEFQKAIELNPSFSWTYHYYALLLTNLGRTDEAIDNLRATLALDPISLPANATLGKLEEMQGHNKEAREQYERALTLSPEFQLTLYHFGTFAAGEGHNAEAIPLLEKALARSPGFPGVRASLAVVYRRVGRTNDAIRLERDLEAAATDDRSRLNLALGYAVLGKTDTAFAMLKTARWDVPTLFELRANPLLANFRKDKRYANLVAAIVAE